MPEWRSYTSAKKNTPANKRVFLLIIIIKNSQPQTQRAYACDIFTPVQIMKKAIIIGASSGIGKELAKILAGQGYIVGITGRRTELLRELAISQPEAYIIRTFDITDTEYIPQHLSALTTELGGLDLLVISSGTGDLNEHLEFTIEKRTIDTNIYGFTAATDWAFRYFESQKSGQVAVISSVAGLRGNHFAPAYNASKAYQINYCEGLRQKARKSKLDITITDIRPGFVKTDMAKGEGQFWVASAEKAARQIFHAIRQKRKVAYITRRWSLIGGLLKVLPRPLYEKM